MTLTVGSLCSGYEGLGLGLGQVLDTDTAWVSEVDPSACDVLSARYPGVPNIGDLTALDWSSVEPVDVLTSGYPCQPFSTAGRRQGANDARHLWPFIADAVGVLRPRLVVLENVAGHLSLGFDSVLADLARLGYDARWTVVRASDVGACHRRARLFIVAHPDGRGLSRDGVCEARNASASGYRSTDRRSRVVTDAGSPRRREVARGAYGDEAAHGGRATGGDHQPVGHGSTSGHDWRMGLEAAADAERSGWDRRARAEGRGPGRRRSLSTVVFASPASSSSADARQAGPQGAQPAPRRDVPDWGAYGPAIARHAAAIGRPAPHPVDGRGRLNPVFVEWMMLLPEGWVTDIVTNRSKALKCLGNGVVPAQAAYALRRLLAALEAAA